MFDEDGPLGFAAPYLQQGYDIAAGWLFSPAAWSQFILLVLAYLAAIVATRLISPRIERYLVPPPGATGPIAIARRMAARFLPLLLPLFAFGFTAIGEAVTRSIFGSGAVIAFGKRVFLFIAARILARDIITEPFLRLLARYVLVPAMFLNMFGLLDVLMQRLEEITVDLGNISFTAMALVRGLIAGSLLFWLGRWSTTQSEDYIKRQQELRPATRELAIKASQIAIMGLAFLLLMSIMGIDLTAIAVLGGALGVGIGLGLQQIAANFVSGVILLIEGQTTVGDYVELDDGNAGTIVKMTARACILQTADGRWIVVPNEDFITSRIANYSDAGKAHRYEAAFSVSYDTDINRVPAMIEAAVGALPFVIRDPEPPECELKGFGESGIDFAVEFWVNGIEDVTGKYQSDVLFCIWNTLKAEAVEIPYPHRVVEIRGRVPA